MEKDQVDLVLWKVWIIPFPQDCLQIANMLLARFLSDVVQELRPDILGQHHSRRCNGSGKRNGEGACAGADVGHHVTWLQLQAGDYIINAQARDPVGPLQPFDPDLTGGWVPCIDLLLSRCDAGLDKYRRDDQAGQEKYP